MTVPNFPMATVEESQEYVMWIGPIRLIVKTKEAPQAGTDSLVQATILRDGTGLGVLNLDYPTEEDLERVAIRDDDDMEPKPYPAYGSGFWPIQW